MNPAKLTHYWLNPVHPHGRHKARVFASALGMAQRDVDRLRGAFLAAAREEATLGVRDAYGQRYVLDFLMDGLSGQAMVRSSWIVLTGEDFPRLTPSEWRKPGTQAGVSHDYGGMACCAMQRLITWRGAPPQDAAR